MLVPAARYAAGVTLSTAQALRNLRKLAGLTPEDAAEKAGVSLAELQRAEDNEPDKKTAGRLASLFGIESDTLFRGEGVTSSLDEGASVFLFSGDLGSFASEDLPAFRAALDYGRIWVERDGHHGLRARLFHRPVNVASPAPRDAARQGYRLARQVRAALGMAGAPIEDIAELAERRLGVVIVVEPLSTKELGAGAILDAARSAAAIVLNDALGPRRHRVALAHELCHLLFDPCGAEMVSLTLDRAELSSSASHDLKEARARGFAAELLLPLAGLVDLLGAPRQVSTSIDARDMIECARVHFGTTWEIAANHLYNTNFISRDAWEGLRHSPTSSTSELPTTTLPDPSNPPRCLGAAPAPARSSPELAASARSAAGDTSRRVEEERNREAARLIATCMDQSETAPMRAGVNLSKALDDAFACGDPALVESVLREIDPRRVHGDTMVMVLSGIRRASEVYGSPLLDAYHTAVARLLDALPVTWSWSNEDVVDARDTLMGGA